MTADQIITAAVILTILSGFAWIIIDFIRYRRSMPKNITVRIPDDSPPRRFTTHTAAEWIDGAYQIIEIKITTPL